MYVIASDSTLNLTSQLQRQNHCRSRHSPEGPQECTQRLPRAGRSRPRECDICKTGSCRTSSKHSSGPCHGRSLSPHSSSAWLTAKGRSLEPAILALGEINPLGAPSWCPQTYSAVQPKSFHGVLTPWLRLFRAHLKSFGLTRSELQFWHIKLDQPFSVKWLCKRW